MNTISRHELQALLGSGKPLALLEALPEKYYRQGHLPSARQLSHERANEVATQLIPSQDTPVVVYCASVSCRNSHQAAQALVDLGYRDVRVYAEGKADWESAGLALEAMSDGRSSQRKAASNCAR